ncbi:hypothetical protein Aduo_010370 [Ancylostoma duodenale]
MFILTNVLTMSRTGSCDDDHSCEHTQLLTDKLQEPSDELVKSSDAQDIPPDRGKNITRKKGFAYSLVTINYVKGARFGLGIKHHKDQVIVSKSEKGSVCGDRLKRLDRIIDVNGTQVADRDVCEEMLIKSLQKTKKVTLLIERPIEKQAIASMEAFLADAGRQSARSSPVRDAGRQSARSSPVRDAGRQFATSSPVRDVNMPKAKKSKSNSLLKKQRSNSLIRILKSGSSRRAKGSTESMDVDHPRETRKVPQRESSDRKMKAHKAKKNSKLLAVSDPRFICDSLQCGFVTVFQIVALKRKPEISESQSINKT